MKGNHHVFTNRSFLCLWLGETISELGGAIGALCNSLLLYELTGSKSAMGTLWLTYFIPSLILQLFIGPFIDRISRKYIMLWSQILRGIVFFLPVILIFSGQIEIWSLFLIQVVLGILQPLYVPAASSLLPTIVEHDKLTQANAWLDGTVRTMSFLAPTLGGLLIAYIGASSTYIMVGTLFLISACSLAYLHESSVTNVKKKVTWLKQIISGYQYFFKQRPLIWLGFFTSLVQFSVGVTMVINVPFIIEELNETSFSYGIFMGSFPFGYVIGSFLVGRWGDTWPRRYMMLSGLLMGGLSFFLLGFVTSFPLAVLCEILGGICFPFFNIHQTSLLQKIVPSHLMGQIFSVRLFLIRATMPLGILFAGQIVELSGIRILYIMIGSFIMIPALFGMLLPFFSFLNEENDSVTNT
ncbi:MFS transporter [Bacillus sp. WLY-B-L8]|uniref:MFS transporter n=1 Tax=Bacillus multifaciens TaxID=3068506 RepID=UPI0027423DFB|nr:MFS transporter [Bacillus sp. WLY-B-L8]MDP7980198.1 MFS transporter [Bacillus sp. WLY-B-L8]